MGTVRVPSTVWAVTLLLLLLPLAETKLSYAGHKLVRAIPTDESQLGMLHDLQRRLEVEEMDVWKYATRVNQPMTVRIPPHNFDSLMRDMTAKGLKPEVAVADIQEAIDANLRSNAEAAGKPANNAENFNYGVYHNLSEIQTWIDDMVDLYKDSFDIKTVEVTTSYENRPISAFNIKTKDGDQNKPIFWFHGGIHAREWISPATVIYMTKQLLEAYSTDEKIKTEMDAWEWYIVPVLNVDGYEYTWTDDRLWRKTRTKHTLCHGTDPNRNWGYHWGEGGASDNPCSETYRGPSAFSEKCTAGASAFLRSLGSRLKAFIDFHSYSQLWMTPWGYTKDKPEPQTYAEQDASSAVAVAALEAVHGTQYQHGPIATTIYVASGNVVDWMYGELGVKYSTTVELRDQGQNGFLLPADQIIPSGEETLAGMLAFLKYARENP